MSFIRQAPAKINLFLRIVARREDGYHEIETLFQRIDLCDELRFQTLEEGEGWDLRCEGIPVDVERPEENLVLRACRALGGFLGDEACEGLETWPPRGVRIELKKKIPLGGGLGGGSSDAAATLRALRDLFELELTEGALEEIALGLGADVPFFLEAPAAIGRGVGERLTPIAHQSAFFVVLGLPEFGVSTAEVYKRFDPAAAKEKGDLEGLTDALLRGDLTGTLSLAFNSMEPLAFALEPALGRLREKLEGLAQRPVRMSGSGSTLFTLAAGEEEAKQIAQRWRACLRCEVARFI